jgi:hypothetical protein
MFETKEDGCVRAVFRPGGARGEDGTATSPTR